MPPRLEDIRVRQEPAWPCQDLSPLSLLASAARDVPATLQHLPLARLDLERVWSSNPWRRQLAQGLEAAFKVLNQPAHEGARAHNFGIISQSGEQLKNLFGRHRQRVKLSLSSWRPLQGETLAILVSVPPPRGFLDWLTAAIRQHWLQQPLVEIIYGGSEVCAYPADTGLWRALVPTTPLSDPGMRPLTVDVKDGRHEMYNGFVEIRSKNYPVESIWLSEPKSGIQGTTAEREAVKDLLSSRSQEQYWNGPFQLPAPGEVTAAYGLQRFYNGVFAEGYYHRGVDYGADEGTPVTAPATGVVALVGREEDGFELHGNCVGLDHGQGVISMLMHLSSVSVQKGMVVQAGQGIGRVGQSGLATGPHLHWGLFVNGEAVDPNPWMEEQPWL